MFLLGASLTKFFATVAALMTVTAGLPTTYCRCPDGRIMLFCQGNASSGCCCSSSSPKTKSCCCQAKKANNQNLQESKKHSCCVRNDGTPRQGSGGDGCHIVAKSPSCVKTLVSDTSAYSVEDSENPVANFGDSLFVWEQFSASPSFALATISIHSSPGVLVYQPDLVIILCHLTC